MTTSSVETQTIESSSSEEQHLERVEALQTDVNTLTTKLNDIQRLLEEMQQEIEDLKKERITDHDWHRSRNWNTQGHWRSNYWNKPADDYDDKMNCEICLRYAGPKSRPCKSCHLYTCWDCALWCTICKKTLCEPCNEIDSEIQEFKNHWRCEGCARRK